MIFCEFYENWQKFHFFAVWNSRKSQNARTLMNYKAKLVFLGSEITFFMKFHFLAEILLFDAKRFAREKVPASAKPEFAAAGTCGKVDFALLFVL